MVLTVRSGVVGIDEHGRYTLLLPVQPCRNRKVLAAQKGRIEQFGLVARAVVAKHRHDGMPGAHFASEPDRASDIDAGRGADAKAFLLEELEDDLHGLRILDPPRVIDLHAFQILCDAALADAFGDGAAFRLKLARSVVAVKRGARRIGETNLDILALGLQADGDTAERAAGANRAAEAVDLPFRLIPDLFGCRLDMCLAVCDVVE